MLKSRELQAIFSLWWGSYITPLTTIFQFGIFSSLLFEGVFEHLYPPDQIVLEVFLTFSFTLKECDPCLQLSLLDLPLRPLHLKPCPLMLDEVEDARNAILVAHIVLLYTFVALGLGGTSGATRSLDMVLHPTPYFKITLFCAPVLVSCRSESSNKSL